MNKIRSTSLGLLLAAAAATSVAHADTFVYRVTAVGVRAPVVSTPPAPVVVADAAVGTLTANTSADFGAVTLNSSASRTFTFSNTGNIAATGVFATISQTTGLSIVSNSCGTYAAPVSVAKNSTCYLTLSYGGATASSLSGANVSLSGAFSGTVQSLPLSGTTGNFNAAAAWSSTNSGTSLTSGDLAFGTKTTATVTTRSFYLRNTGSSGAQSVGFTLTGDTSFFKITGIRPTNSSVFLDACQGGGFLLAGDGLSATPCKAYDVAGGQYPLIRVVVSYSPTTIGTHSVTITPSTNNGTALPEPITLTGRGEFNSAAAWSSTMVAGGTSLADSDVNFGTKTTSTVTTKTFYLRNTGTNGAQAVGFTLSGDTGFFKITGIRPTNSSGGLDACQGAGFLLAGDGLSSTPCKAYDIAGGGYPLLRVVVSYSPATIGTHTITITPSTDNGTVLPAPISLTGTRQ